MRVSSRSKWIPRHIRSAIDVRWVIISAFILTSDQKKQMDNECEAFVRRRSARGADAHAPTSVPAGRPAWSTLFFNADPLAVVRSRASER
jgi:hypothetical protein